MWDRVRGGTGRKLTPSLILSLSSSLVPKNIVPPPVLHLDSPLVGSQKNISDPGVLGTIRWERNI